MKKIFLISILILVNSVSLLFGQDIYKKEQLILPQPPATALIIGSGQTVSISSATSVLLGPGTHLQSGANVKVYITNGLFVPAAPSNPTSDSNMNWVQNKVYDEDGNLVGENKSFFDNRGQVIQNQVKSLSVGHVLASQTLSDALLRPVIQTLPAPINNAEFSFKDKFVNNAAGNNYSFSNFDLLKTNSPDAVGSSSEGTLGWYYSNNNSLESYVPATNFPYTRSSFYEDGSNAQKSMANVGDELRMGKNHEIQNVSFPVLNELDNYTLIRNKFFPISEVGEQNSLNSRALQSVTMDQNGNKSIEIIDLSKKLLMSARADANGILTINNSTTLKAVPSEFIYNVRTVTGPVLYPVQSFSIQSRNEVTVFKAGVLIYTGKGSDFVFGPLATSNILYQVKSQLPFTINNYSNCESCPSIASESSTRSIHYFQLIQPSNVTISGNYELYNMKTETLVTGYTGNSVLPEGYYKVRAIDGDVTIGYSNKVSDVSYNFYNQLGQLVSTIAPEGVKKLVENLSAYTSIASVPFVSRYSYDLQGRVIAVTTPDAGTTEFIYRKDGNIRFSQNAEQRKTGKFSYTNYDEWGRTFEAGEYTPGTITFAAAKTNTTLLEAIDDTGGLTGGTKTFQVKTHFEMPDNSHGLNGYVQDEGFLKGAISWTENQNAKTWYNYDSQGRVTWTIKQINGLGNKTINYLYNSNGGVSKIDYQKETPGERFVHYYEYDKDLRLSAVYTSTDDIARVFQARYYYYLHGPLKRVELADNLQGIDYTYTVQGWLKSINHLDNTKDPGNDGNGNGFSQDAFSMALEYFNGDYSRTGTGINSIATGNPKTWYNGNITAQSWRSQKPNSVVATYGASVNNPATFTYDYDNRYQFQSNKYGAPNLSTNSFTETTNANRESNLGYDANGNITSLSRSNAAGASTANFTYNYQPNTNKLQSVGGYASYSYDDLGQMTSQQKTAGAAFYNSYDLNGKVVGIYSDAAQTQLKVSFAYDESGMRIRKTDHTQNITTYYVYDSDGSVLAIYDNTGSGLSQKEVPLYAAGRIGMYRRVSNTYQYELTDHLGNVRVVLNRNKVDGKVDVASYSDYYPFGMPLTLANNDYRYGFQGKYAELDKETGWNSFELRMYDPAIGRWLNVDPENEFYSPYLAMGNNPVSIVDPDGGSTEDPPGKTYLGNNGNSLKEVVIQGQRMSPQERMSARTDRGVNPYIYSNGSKDNGAEIYAYNYAAYQRVKAAQPDFEGYILNGAMLLTGAGEMIEGGAALYGLGRYGYRKLLQRGIMSEVRAVGMAGEEAVGITGPKTAIEVGGRTRFPDRLAEGFLEEVKNVKYQSFTRQLRDFYQYSQENGLDMILHTRSNTTLSKPLQSLVDQGLIIHKIIPGM